MSRLASGRNSSVQSYQNTLIQQNSQEDARKAVKRGLFRHYQSQLHSEQTDKLSKTNQSIISSANSSGVRQRNVKRMIVQEDEEQTGEDILSKGSTSAMTSIRFTIQNSTRSPLRLKRACTPGTDCRPAGAARIIKTTDNGSSQYQNPYQRQNTEDILNQRERMLNMHNIHKRQQFFDVRDSIDLRDWLNLKKYEPSPLRTAKTLDINEFCQQPRQPQYTQGDLLGQNKEKNTTINNKTPSDNHLISLFNTPPPRNKSTSSASSTEFYPTEKSASRGDRILQEEPEYQVEKGKSDMLATFGEQLFENITLSQNDPDVKKPKEPEITATRKQQNQKCSYLKQALENIPNQPSKQHLMHRRPSSGKKIINQNGESLFFGNSHLADASNGNEECYNNHKLENFNDNYFYPSDVGILRRQQPSQGSYLKSNITTQNDKQFGNGSNDSTQNSSKILMQIDNNNKFARSHSIQVKDYIDNNCKSENQNISDEMIESNLRNQRLLSRLRKESQINSSFQPKELEPNRTSEEQLLNQAALSKLYTNDPTRNLKQPVNQGRNNSIKNVIPIPNQKIINTIDPAISTHQSFYHAQYKRQHSQERAINLLEEQDHIVSRLVTKYKKRVEEQETSLKRKLQLLKQEKDSLMQLKNQEKQLGLLQTNLTTKLDQFKTNASFYNEKISPAMPILLPNMYDQVADNYELGGLLDSLVSKQPQRQREFQDNKEQSKSKKDIVKKKRKRIRCLSSIQKKMN